MKFSRKSNIFIQENPLENVVCEMASILSRPQCVKCAHKPNPRHVVGDYTLKIITISPRDRESKCVNPPIHKLSGGDYEHTL